MYINHHNAIKYVKTHNFILATFDWVEKLKAEEKISIQNQKISFEYIVSLFGEISL